MFPREILNKLIWTDNPDLLNVVIHYRHRGAPDDLKAIEGHQIVSIERSYFIIGSEIHKDYDKRTSIPYHRIEKIQQNGKVIYDRDDYRKQCKK